MPQQVYNIENSVDAANMAVYYTTTTGQTHTFVGPNPPIR